MRLEIVLDTETTGLEPKSGHRIVEIGCVEIQNFMPTGRVFHTYLNPQRDMSPGAFAVHGLSTEFLVQHPLFDEVKQQFVDFVADNPLVIHNAPFDMKFLQAELAWANLQPLENPIVDTLTLARRKFPGAPASLDVLCRKFRIDRGARDKGHGALLDAQLLAQVYLELCEGRQPTFGFHGDNPQNGSPQGDGRVLVAERPLRAPRSFPLTAEEQEAHDAMVASLSKTRWMLSSKS